MRDRAVVLEIRGRRATVLLPGGEFKTIKSGPPGLVVGQEVWVPSSMVRRWWQAGAVMATSLALIFVGLAEVMAPAAPLAVAVVSVDINPSINLMVGPHQQVIAAVGLDNAGRHILAQYHPVNTSVSRAVEEVTQWAVHDGYVRKENPTLLIGGVFSGAVPSWFPRLTTKETDIVAEKHWALKVVRVSTESASLVTSMGQSPISVGRYLLWQHDRHQGRGWTQTLAQTAPLTQLVGNTPIISHNGSGSDGISNSIILPSISSANIGINIPIGISPSSGKSKSKGHHTHQTQPGAHHSHKKTPKSSPSDSTSSTLPVISGSVPPSTIPSLPSSVSGNPSPLESSISNITSELPRL